jgi:cytochrome oxidase assembly protein ShyY1
MVALALPILIALGLWQLQRAEWKAALLDQYASNSRAPVVELGEGPIPEDAQFRTVRLFIECPEGPPIIRAGRNLAGQVGYSHLARCRVGATPLLLDSFWAPRPDATWFGGDAERVAQGWTQGVLVRQANDEWLLVQARVSPFLEPSAPPSLDTIPNNHFSYAIQWFSFAAILLVIYALYLRRWRRGA